MRVIGREKLTEFITRHPDSAGPLAAWEQEVLKAEWQKPLDIKQKYPKASIISGSRVVFNIRGNEFRLDVAIAYKTGIVQIMRVGTHEEYDEWKF